MPSKRKSWITRSQRNAMPTTDNDTKATTAPTVPVDPYDFEHNPDWSRHPDGGFLYTRKRVYASTWSDGYGAYGQWNGSTYNNDKLNCKHEPLVGCTVGGITLYPTWSKSITESMLQNFDVVVPLTDTAPYTNMYDTYCGIIMWFPIKDMTAPDPMRLRVNAQRILDFANAGAKVAFWCIGSHGRTGTVLATCIGLAEPDIEDPIVEARTRHCKHAIETNAQEIAVFKALGREVPDKYKPKPVNAGTWNKNTAWPSEQTEIAALLNGGFNVCDICEKPETKLRPLHWIGREHAHWDCVTANTKRKNRKKTTDQTKALTPSQIKEQLVCMYCTGTKGTLIKYSFNGTFVGYAHQTCYDSRPATSKVKSSAQPSADSPPLDDTIVDAENAIPQDAVDDDTMALTVPSAAEYKELVTKSRPFNKHWSTESVSLLVNVANGKDQFGDLICPLCERLVIDDDPTKVTVDRLDGKSYTVHTNCDEFEDDPDTMVLCKYCLDGEASEVYTGCCSVACELALAKHLPIQGNKET